MSLLLCTKYKFLHERPQTCKSSCSQLPSSRHIVLTTLSSIRDPKTPRYVEISSNYP